MNSIVYFSFIITFVFQVSKAVRARTLHMPAVKKKIEWRRRAVVLMQATLRTCLAIKHYRHLYRGTLRLRALVNTQLGEMSRIVEQLKGPDRDSEQKALVEMRARINQSVVRMRPFPPPGSPPQQGIHTRTYCRILCIMK